MKCEEALQKITPYIENQLQPRELEEFIAHIKNCSSCYDELETYYIVSQAVRYLDDDNQDTYNILDLLKYDIRMKEQHLRRRKMVKSLFFLLVLSGLLLVAAWLLCVFGILELPFMPEFISI